MITVNEDNDKAKGTQDEFIFPSVLLACFTADLIE